MIDLYLAITFHFFKKVYSSGLDDGKVYVSLEGEDHCT